MNGETLSLGSRSTVGALADHLAGREPPPSFKARTRHDYDAAIDELRRVAGGGRVDERRLLYLVMGTLAGGQAWADVFEAVPRPRLGAVLPELMTGPNDLSPDTRSTLASLATYLSHASDELPDFQMLTGYEPGAAITELRRGATGPKANVSSLLHIVSGVLSHPGIPADLFDAVSLDALQRANQELTAKRTPVVQSAISGPTAAQAREDFVGYKIWTKDGLTSTGVDP